MKILLAEDELLERKAMKKFIQDNFHQMTVVGEAVNGRQAIQLAKELQPNIIFMDIKMPGINGLEAIEQIHATQPTIKFILVSAYDTFEYAKQAMQFGIKDFILKPEKKEEIVRALLRIREEILREEKLLEKMRQSEQLMKEGLVRKIIQSPVNEDVDELVQRIFPNMKSGYFLVLSAHVPIDILKMEELLTHHFSDQFIVYEGNEVFVVFIVCSTLIEKSSQLLFARHLHLVLGEEVFIGIGQSCTSVEELPISYRKAYEASKQHKNANQSKYGFVSKGTLSEVADKDRMIAKIIRAIEEGNGEQAMGGFKENQENFVESDREKLYIAIENIFSSRKIERTTHSMASLQSTRDWLTHLEVCCLKIQEHYQSRRSMTKAKEFIEQHFASEVTLEDVAVQVNLSPNYFSNLCKEEFGETFIELLTRTRMEKARGFIEENTHSLKEISFMVGYKDPNYFSRVFKRYYLHSPRKYQEMIFNK